MFSLFLLSHVPLRAQDFLTKIDSSELGLTEGENAYLARIMAAGMADEINFCEMADVEDFQRSGIYFIEVWTPTDRFTQTLSIFHN